jgi:hypothetical protein
MSFGGENEGQRPPFFPYDRCRDNGRSIVKDGKKAESSSTKKLARWLEEKTADTMRQI